MVVASCAAKCQTSEHVEHIFIVLKFGRAGVACLSNRHTPLSPSSVCSYYYSKSRYPRSRRFNMPEHAALRSGPPVVRRQLRLVATARRRGACPSRTALLPRCRRPLVDRPVAEGAAADGRTPSRCRRRCWRPRSRRRRRRRRRRRPLARRRARLGRVLCVGLGGQPHGGAAAERKPATAGGPQMMDKRRCRLLHAPSFCAALDAHRAPLAAEADASAPAAGARAATSAR